ncbi:MAG TPA: hypothetical protein VFR94_00270 [Nitrososphaeraceae archaeon]|nr:hypothetical protein [Nitrososphaeraceae archaeon]
MQEFGSQRQIPRGLNSTTVGGHPVFRGESEPETESAGNKMLHVWALVDDDAYTFSFSARQSDYQEYLPTIEKMINSFRFLNVSSLDSISRPVTNQQTGQAEVTSRPELTVFLS